jgi:Heparinase II/III-like protein
MRILQLTFPYHRFGEPQVTVATLVIRFCFGLALALSLSLALACGSNAWGQTIAVNFPPNSPDPLATLSPAHPRLIASMAQFNALASSNDPLQTEVQQRIIATADTMQNTPLVPYALTGPETNLLASSRAAFQDIVLNAMAYRLTRQPRYAVRARNEMVNVAGYPNWNPVHFLDTGEMAMGVALGYDWIYDALSPADRATIQQALITNVLSFAPQIYGTMATNPAQLSWQFQWAIGEYNWNQVCNGGMLAAALAVADVLPALARMVVQGVRASLPIALQGYAPDGAWFEGPVYASYATGYTALTLSILQSALGTDFGLSTVEPAFSAAGLFHLQEQDPSELLFNFGDAESGDDIEYGVHPAFGWLATRFNSPQVATEVRADLALEFTRFAANQEMDQYFALNALWLPFDPGNAGSEPLDVHFGGASDVVISRSSWTDPNAIYLGFKAGINGFNHSHLDLGSFVFDSDGIRWALQLGPDSYGLPLYNTIVPGSPRWTYYRASDYSKSTIVPAHLAQSVLAVAPIYSFTSTPSQASAIADLTSVYPGVSQRMLRGVFFLNRSSVLIQDDITALQPNTTLVWQMLTQAPHISISANGQTVTLTQNAKVLQLQILSPANARFSVSPAIPSTTAENQNANCYMLVATVPSASQPANLRLAVLLSPVGPNWPANPAIPQLSPLPTPPQ